jgi:hypothetical protein
MSSTLRNMVGIQSLSASGLISKITTSFKKKLKVIPLGDSSFGQAAALDPVGEFTIEGYGPQTAAMGAAASNAPSLCTGGVITIHQLGHTQKGGEFEKFKYTGKWHPNAT